MLSKLNNKITVWIVLDDITNETPQNVKSLDFRSRLFLQGYYRDQLCGHFFVLIYVNDMDMCLMQTSTLCCDSALLVSGEHTQCIKTILGGQLVVSQQLVD